MFSKFNHFYEKHTGQLNTQIHREKRTWSIRAPLEMSVCTCANRDLIVFVLVLDGQHSSGLFAVSTRREAKLRRWEHILLGNLRE